MDFSECRFIEEAMKYYTYFDFCDNRRTIRLLFNVLTEDGQLFYKWFVYANIHMNETYKNAIWDYLNGYDENGFELLRLKRLYRAK